MPEDATQAEVAATAGGANPLGGVTALTGLAVLLLLELLSWATEGGGILSIVSAISSVSAQAPAVDIDSAGLRLPIVALMWLLTAGIYRFGKIRPDFSRRRNTALPIVLVIGGGFLLDALCGPAAITGAMESAGYARCASRDHAVGNGKSRVWFAGYVRSGGRCPNGE